MKVVTKRFLVSAAISGKTRVRVYCTHGYWDGTYINVQKTHTSNQPDKLVQMVNIKPDDGGFARAQHPRQCREIVRVVNKNEVWVPCRRDTGEPHDFSDNLIYAYGNKDAVDKQLALGGYLNKKDFEAVKFIRAPEYGQAR